jgi:hypothetical protein
MPLQERLYATKEIADVATIAKELGFTLQGRIFFARRPIGY